MKPVPGILSPPSANHTPRSAAAPAASWIPRRILVAIDFSHCSMRALDCALALSESFDSHLTLLHIMEPPAHAAYPSSPASGFNESTQHLLEEARERLGALARKRLAQRHAEPLVRMGHAYSEISDTAKALAADLIVLGAQGDTYIKHIALGSTAERVVRHAPCPVLTVPDVAN